MIDTTKLEAARKLFADYGDAAWLLLDPVRSANLHAGPVIYLCDVESGRTLLLETAAGALQTLSDQADLDESGYLKVRAALAMLIGDLLNSSDGIHPDTRRGVILGVAFCISETRGFHITRHHGANVQYLLLRYPDAVTKGHMLTPMPVFKTHPIAAVDLNSTATHVLLSEQLNFPERFARSQPLSFKETKRHVLSGKL
ncbi:MAG: hypothetical protein AB7T07_04335 [Steroidobacteraceae bacterium]